MKNLVRIIIGLCVMGYFHIINAQSYPPVAKIYGTSPFKDSMWSINPNTYQVIDRMSPILTGSTITGINSLAEDPCTHKIYAVVKLSGVTGRVLVTMDLSSGDCMQVGNLHANFATIAFDDSGNLYGVTGQSGGPTEVLFSINKATADTTRLIALGNGADGEVISYNKFNKAFYFTIGQVIQLVYTKN